MQFIRNYDNVLVNCRHLLFANIVFFFLFIYAIKVCKTKRNQFSYKRFLLPNRMERLAI